MNYRGINSIKIKFTIAFSIVLTIVILLLSNLIYIFAVRTTAPNLRRDEVIKIAKEHPDVYKIIKNNNQPIKVEQLAEIGSTIQEIQRKKFTQNLIIVTIPIIVVSTIFAYGLSSYLVRPIERLSLQISQIQPWQMQERIPELPSSEEIENLTNRFNNLMDRLEKSFNAQEEFIQDAAHELRTPIAAILSNIQVIQSKSQTTKEDYKNTLETIAILSKQLANLNESLLILNRQNVEKEQYQKCNITELLEEVVESLKPIIKNEEINIDFDIPDDNWIYGDASMLVRAYKNIIENAIKYSPQQTKVHIDGRKKDNSVEIRISDNGPGIPKQDLPNIFKRFYRGQNGQNLKPNGSGLGLAITKKIIDDHNGKIEITSDKEEGTTVITRLPLINDPKNKD